MFETIKRDELYDKKNYPTGVDEQRLAEIDREEIIDQLREELGREPTSKEIEISMLSIDEGQG